MSGQIHHVAGTQQGSRRRVVERGVPPTDRIQHLTRPCEDAYVQDESSQSGTSPVVANHRGQRIAGWPLLWATALVVLLGLAVATVASWLLGMIAFGVLPSGQWWEVGPAQGDEGWLAPVKVALAVAAGVGGAVALVVAYRKQSLAERDERRQLADSQRAQERAYLDQYRGAVEQLGHANATVRLAGTYALANLADAWVERRQQCVDVLCAHLRTPWSPAGRNGEEQVRSTIVRLIGVHLLTGPRPEGYASWSGLSLDLSRAHLPGSDWSKCNISELNLYGSTVTEGVGFEESTFTGAANFKDATFLGGLSCQQATFKVSPVFHGTSIVRVANFSQTLFSEGGWFVGSQFSHGASFSSAQFHGHALFMNARFGSQSPFDVVPEVARSSVLSLGFPTQFNNALFGEDVHFDRAVFEGDLELIQVQFASNVGFGQTSFMGRVLLSEASFAKGVPAELAGFADGSI